MLWWIAQNAFVAGLLAAVVAVVCRLGRFSPAVRHALWMLVLVKLVTPPIGWYRVPLSVERIFATGTLQAIVAKEQTDPSAAELLVGDAYSVDDLDAAAVAPGRDLLAKGESLEILPQSNALDRTFTYTNPKRKRGASVPLPRLRFGFMSDGSLAVLVWLSGAIPLATFQTIRLVRLWRLMRRATPAPPWLDRLVRQTAARLNVRAPEVAVVPVLCSPLVCALGSPRLLWPAMLSDRLTHDAREAVFLHELAHLRRRDHWVAWLELIAGVVWWFNPVYWYVRHQLRENAELACDAWVVGLLPSGRRAYAQALIEVTEFVSSAPADLPAVAMGNVARSSLERRLTMIMNERTAYRVPLLGSGLIGLALLAVLPGWSRGQTPQEPATTPRTGSQQEAAQLPPAANRAAAQLPRDANPAAAQLPLDANPAAAQLPPGPNQPTAQPPAVANPAASQIPPGLPPGPDVSGPAGPAVSQGAGNQEEQPTAEIQAKVIDAEMQQLEARLQQLVNEVERHRQAVRTGAPKGPAPQNEPRNPQLGRGAALRHNQRGGYVSQNPAVQGGYGGYVVTPGRGGLAGYPNQPLTLDLALAGDRGGNESVETLTRARYKLPQDAGVALAAFIKQFADADVEARAEGETLTVTASPDDQRRIAAFVELLKGPSAEKSR